MASSVGLVKKGGTKRTGPAFWVVLELLGYLEKIDTVLWIFTYMRIYWSDTYVVLYRPAVLLAFEMLIFIITTVQWVR